MRLSQSFARTTKTISADEQSLNAKLLIQAGFIHKEMAGVYSYLPLGYRVLENIKQIVREEMNALGAQELAMSALQPQENWQATGRWDDELVDIWFKTELKNGQNIGLGWSHEEPMLLLAGKVAQSYRDLPIAVYQMQNKFRNELRSKSGIMRGREFLMKDMYHFARNLEELEAFYTRVQEAYFKVFERVGLKKLTFLTYASGGAFTDFSHEFQCLAESGEDTIYIDRSKKLAVNEEVYTDEVLNSLGLKKEELEQAKASEIGNIFNFKTTKAEQMGICFTDEQGRRQPMFLSSYGIGVSRLMGVIAELFNDDKGLIFPLSVAPATIYMIAIGGKETIKVSEKLYNTLTERGVAVIYDDRAVRPGEKFADADLMGIPYRVVLNDSTSASGRYEVKGRTESEPKHMDLKALIELSTSAMVK